MKKVAIELFGPNDDRAVTPRSPLVWNGLEFTLCEELPMSFFSSLFRAVKETNLDVEYRRFVLNGSQYASKALVEDVRTWYAQNLTIVDEITSLAIKTRSEVAKRRDDVETVADLRGDLRRKLDDISLALTKVKSGSLLLGGTHYRATYDSATGTYTIQREARPEINFVVDDAISIDRSADGSLITINFDPTMDFKILSGQGTYQVTNDSYSTVNLSNIFNGFRGFTVKASRDNYAVSVNPQFLASRNSKLKVFQDQTTGFRVALDSDFKYQLDFAFLAGYGIDIDGRSVTVGNVVPVVSGQGGATVTPVVVNGQHTNKLSVSLNPVGGFKVAPAFTATWPLLVTTQTLDDTSGVGRTIYTIGVAADYANKVNNTLYTINKSLTNSEHRALNVSMETLTQEARYRLACPLLNLFQIATTNTVSAAVKAGFDARTTKLVNKFGVAPKSFDVFVDVLPMADVSRGGPGATFGTSFEINVYTYLQNYLREQLADPSFTILEAERGSRFLVLGVHEDLAAFSIKGKAELGTLEYNTPWVVDSTAISTTYPGKLVAFTTGDYDFFAGFVRNGQTNNLMVALTAPMQAELNAGTFGVSVTSQSTRLVSAGVVAYTYNLYDRYTDSNYTVTWSKPTAITSRDTDYMKELTSTSLPTYVRLVGRLLANWGYDTHDLVLAIKILQNEVTTMLVTNVDNIYAQIASANRLKDSELADMIDYSLVLSSFDKTTGTAVVTVDSVRELPSTDTALYSLDSVLKSIRLGFYCRINPIPTNWTIATFDAACNWDNLPYVETLPCEAVGTTLSTKTLAGKDDLYKFLTGAASVPTTGGSTGGAGLGSIGTSGSGTSSGLTVMDSGTASGLVADDPGASSALTVDNTPQLAALTVSEMSLHECAALLFDDTFRVTPSTTIPPCVNPPKIEDELATYQPRMRIKWGAGWSDEMSLVVTPKTALATKITNIYRNQVNKRSPEKAGLRFWNDKAVAGNWTDAQLLQEITNSFNGGEKSYGGVIGVYNYCEWKDQDVSTKPPDPACACIHHWGTPSPEADEATCKSIYDYIFSFAVGMPVTSVTGYVVVVREFPNKLEFCGTPYNTTKQRNDILTYNKAIFKHNFVYSPEGLMNVKLYLMSEAQLKAYYPRRQVQSGMLDLKFCHYETLKTAFTIIETPVWYFPENKVCNQNPTGPVREMRIATGQPIPGNSIATMDYYALYAQADFDKADGGVKYLLMSTVNVDTDGVHDFHMISDDDVEVYINCQQIFTGQFGTHAFTHTLRKGPVQLIMRYKNIPDQTPGYAALNVFQNGRLVYQARAANFKGQVNAIGEIEWTT